MAAGTTRTTRVTPKGRAYLAEHPGIDWRAPDPGPRVLRFRAVDPATPPAEPTPIAAVIPPLRIANQAICPPCGSGNVLSLWRSAYFCRDCGHRFDVKA